jgi:adenylate cyclase
MLTNEVMINTMTVNAAIIFYAVAAVRRAEVELENEHERSEAVTTMLPASSQPGSRPSQMAALRGSYRLSILFAHLVGFTNVAHELPPEQVVAILTI